MADIKFDVTKLTDPQLEVAAKIVDACNAVGVNPDLVLPMAYVESRFNPDVADSSKGAIGIMQLMPDTAKFLKVNPRDVNENIKGGCLFIRNLMENPKIAHDPTKVIAAYHDGPNSKFFKTGNPADISDAAIEYVDMVNTLSKGLIAPPTTKTSGEAPSTTAEAAPTEAAPVPAPVVDTWSTAPLPAASTDTAGGEKPEYGFDPLAMSGGALPGTMVGTAVGTGRTAMDVGRRVGDVASQVSSNLLQASRGTPPAPTAPGRLPTAPAPAHGGSRWVSSLTDVDLPGGQMNQRSLSEAQRLASIVSREGELAGGELRSGVAIGPDIRSKVPTPTVGQRVSRALAPVSRVVNAPYVQGPLAGLGMGAMGGEAMSRYEKDDIPGAVVAGTGALASGASMLGYRPAMPVAMAAPAVLAGMDLYRNKGPEAINAAILKELKDWENSFKAGIKRYQSGKIPVTPDALSGGLQ